MNNLVENKYGHGGVPDKVDTRDFIFPGAGVFDWNKGYNVEEVIGKQLTIKNQGQSFSCGGQAWSYYGESLFADSEKSAKFIYAQTFVPGGGSAGRDNCNIVIKQGFVEESILTSYENGSTPSEAFITRSQDITQPVRENALKERTYSYAQTGSNIDTVALALQANKGVIICIGGQNNGTWLGSFPQPPQDSTEWYHWLYCGKAKLIDGKKYIGVLNSWGAVGEMGWQWLGEEYFNKAVFGGWTLQKKAEKYKFNKDFGFLSMGKDVLELQKRLEVKQTGFFYTATRDAVKKFQKLNGILQTGYVGPLTRVVLNN